MTQLDVITSTTTTTTTIIIIIVMADYITYHKCIQKQRLRRRYKDTLNAEAERQLAVYLACEK